MVRAPQTTGQTSPPLTLVYHPSPTYYPYTPSIRPYPFMGLRKFVAGRIHQVLCGKGYLSADPSWDKPDSDTTCPLSSEASQTFTHAILSRPSSACQRSRLLQGVLDLAPQAPIWSDQQLLIAIAEFIHTTATGFPSRMSLLAPSLHTLPNPLFPSTSPLHPWPSRLVGGLYFSLFLATAALRRLSVALEVPVVFVSFVDCYFDFRFCFGLIVKHACHFLYHRNNENMI